MTCLIWSHRRPFSASCSTTFLFRENCSKVWPNNYICKQLPSVVPKKRCSDVYWGKKMAENSHYSVHEWSKWYTFSTFVVPLSLGFLFQQFSPSLFGETAVSKDFQLMWSSQQNSTFGGKGFQTEAKLAILMIWHHRNVLWPYTYVRLPLVVITVFGYIIISWNDLIQNKVVEKVKSNKTKSNVLFGCSHYECRWFIFNIWTGLYTDYVHDTCIMLYYVALYIQLYHVSPCSP